ncbi:HNH endonuclease, partial [Methylotetracoccus oryzae]|uniref:HNH endonuclease n=1 Tax=Methylotetracoccus oryzae TaxID=1919059 RepID=UPI001F1FEC5F
GLLLLLVIGQRGEGRLFHPVTAFTCSVGDSLPAAFVQRLPNVAQLRRVAIGAELVDGTLELLMDEESRACLAATLLTSHFSPEVAVRLQEQRRLHGEAFDYSVALDHSVGEQVRVSDVMGPGSYQPAARSQGFRRSIVMHYDHRCALCGIRIVTPEGQTAVDAAHIVPWSVSRNDDIRNGMALCKLCHWAFDRGMMSISDSYTVVLSRNLSSDNNAAGLLGVLTGRRLVGPLANELWPHRDNLAWHRKQYGFT